MQIEFIETFDCNDHQGEIIITLVGPVTQAVCDSFNRAVGEISRSMSALIVAPEFASAVALATGKALDPSELTGPLPGINLTDRRRKKVSGKSQKKK